MAVSHLDKNCLDCLVASLKFMRCIARRRLQALVRIRAQDQAYTNNVISVCAPGNLL
jgi:hypothetical protein